MEYLLNFLLKRRREMEIAEISIPSTKHQADLDDLKFLCRTECLAAYSENLPTPGQTGYLDVWDETYLPGSFGYDVHGRRYLITRPLAAKEERDGTRRRFLLCVFQRYSGDNSILVSTTKRLSVTGGNPDNLWYDPIPHELSKEDVEAMTNLARGKSARFPACLEYTVNMERRKEYGACL